MNSGKLNASYHEIQIEKICEDTMEKIFDVSYGEVFFSIDHIMYERVEAGLMSAQAAHEARYEALTRWSSMLETFSDSMEELLAAALSGDLLEDDDS